MTWMNQDKRDGIVLSLLSNWLEPMIDVHPRNCETCMEKEGKTRTNARVEIYRKELLIRE